LLISRQTRGGFNKRLSGTGGISIALSRRPKKSTTEALVDRVEGGIEIESQIVDARKVVRARQASGGGGGETKCVETFNEEGRGEETLCTRSE